MKYLSEFRDAALISKLLADIRQSCRENWQIMEVCGGQTHSLAKNGILDLLPSNITMVHGPGCPVCVTSACLIDQAIHLSLDRSVVMCTFGDMLRVPGSTMSLVQAKAIGADVRVLYSPMDAVRIAEENPEKEIVFFAVGFETTAPSQALAVLEAKRRNLENFSLLAAQVLVPPAMEAILEDKDTQIDAFLAPGHVCTVMGTEEYEAIVAQHRVPIVVTGFEPLDLLQGILMAVRQLERGEARLEIQYSRVVQPEGNILSKKVLNEVFEPCPREWRGIGTLPSSGFALRKEWEVYDAAKKFGLTSIEKKEMTECMSGDVMKGKIKPTQCPHFGKGCSPDHPMGAPMVSSEGACSAYYLYQIAGS